MDILALLAQVDPVPPPTGPPVGPNGAEPVPAPGWYQFLSTFGWVILILVIFYIMVIRSKQRTERSRRDMLDTLKKGDEVQTIGGILGKVVEARDDRVLLKVDESSNTKVWFSRGAIHRVLTGEKEGDIVKRNA